MNGGPLLASNETMKVYDVHELIKNSRPQTRESTKAAKAGLLVDRSIVMVARSALSDSDDHQAIFCEGFQKYYFVFHSHIFDFDQPTFSKLFHMARLWSFVEKTENLRRVGKMPSNYKPFDDQSS